MDYNVSVTAERPGGDLSYVQIVPKDSDGPFPMADDDSYWMIGDYQSVNTILSLLVDNYLGTSYGCGAENGIILPFITVGTDGGPLQYDTSINNGTTLPFHFENVIQWYRASSFALAAKGYNNTSTFLPHNETTEPSDWATSTPVPNTQFLFRSCVNRTIYSALPILDAKPPEYKMPIGVLLGIILGSILGAVIIVLVCCVAWRKK